MKIEIDKQLEVLKKEKKDLVLSAFAPIVQGLNELAENYPEIQEMEQTPERSAKAKRFRIDLKKAINQADAKRKDLKDESLQEGRAIQSVFNHIKEVTAGTVEEVISIEKFYENLELEKQEKLRKERLLELEKYEVDGSGLSLGTMDETIWKNMLLGSKTQYEENQAADRKAEEERVEVERIDKLHTERKDSILHLWKFVDLNLQEKNLGMFADSAWSKIVEQLEELGEKETEKQEKIKADNEKLRIENEKNQTEIDKLQRQKDAKAKKDRDVKNEEAAERQRIASAPEKEKLLLLVDQMETVETSLSTQFAMDVVNEAAEIIRDYARTL